MGFSKNQAIIEANRNEANEAIELLRAHQEFLYKKGLIMQAVDIADAIALIKKFEAKHVEPCAWDLK